MIKGLNQASKEVHKANREKGFYDKERETGTLLMLITSELAEALEADRKNRTADKTSFEHYQQMCNDESFSNIFNTYVKDTFEDEISDTFIRLMDLCGYMDIDIEWHIEQKLKYNKTREKMHGKNY